MLHGLLGGGAFLSYEALFMTGAETVVGMDGYLYPYVLNALNENPTMSTADVARFFAESAGSVNGEWTHGAYDLSKIPELDTAMNQVSDAFIAHPEWAEDFRALRAASAAADGGYHDYFDRGRFWRSTEGGRSSRTLRSGAGHRSGTLRGDSGEHTPAFDGIQGLSIFADTSGQWSEGYSDGAGATWAQDTRWTTGLSHKNHSQTVSSNMPTEELSERAVHQARRKGLFWAVLNIGVIAAIIFGVLRVNGGGRSLACVAASRSEGVLGGMGIDECRCLCTFIAGGRFAQIGASQWCFLGRCTLCCTLAQLCDPHPLVVSAAAWFASKRSWFEGGSCLVAGTTARLIGLLSAAVGAVCLWPFVSLELPPEYLPIFQVLVLGMAGCSLLLASLMALPQRFGPVTVHNPQKEKEP